MVETGKRYRAQRDNDDDNGKYQKKKANNKESSNDDGLVVYRILCPAGVIGNVIGKSGKVINSIRQETRAKIKVVDPFPGSEKRVITIYCHVGNRVEVDDDNDSMIPLCPAQDALFRVHSTIANAVASSDDSDKKNKEEATILVPSSQVANIIGKAGSTIKKVRTNTRANIKITSKDANDPTHSCALSFDNFIQITGDANQVKRALYAISLLIYKFAPKEEIPLESNISDLPQDLPPNIIIPSDVPIFPAGGYYPSVDAIVPPPRSLPSILGGPTLPPDIQGFNDSSSAWPGYASSLPPAPSYGVSNRSEELVLRVLCPSDKIGRVIGKGGSSIKGIRQSSGARLDVDDIKNDSDECVITVTSTESTNDMKSSAVEAVLLLQGKINDEDDDSVTIRLLVPSKVIGCIIGKSGAIVNEIRKRTKADVRITKKEKPKLASEHDELIEISGEVSSVRDALVQITLRLRDDVLKDREANSRNVPATDMYMGASSLPPAIHNTPAATSLGFDQRTEPGSGLGFLPSGNLYGYSSLQGGDNGYDSYLAHSTKQFGGRSSLSEMVIPANSVGRVMGKGGANLNTIRKLSGAVLEVVDSKSSRGDRIAQISGTPEQKHLAETIIQAYILMI